MKKGLFLLAISFIAFACNTTKKKALDFNNKIAGYSLELEKRGTALSPVLQKAVETKDFTEFSKMVNDLHSYIKSKSVELDNLENVGGSEDLKSAMKDFMRYEKDLTEETLLPFTKFDSTTDDGEIQTALQNLVSKSQEESTYLDKVKKEQAAFAAKNGFKIEGQK